MKVLVFGGTGAIGRYVVAELVSRGHNVTVASRSPADDRSDTRLAGAEQAACDIQRRTPVVDFVRRVRPEGVIHLAAALQFACEDDPSIAVRVNVNGTANVLEACRQANVRRVIFGSSVAVYGSNQFPLTEDIPSHDDVSVYGAAKRLEERLGVAQASLAGSDFIALRYSGVFGPVAPSSGGMALVRARILSTYSGHPVIIPEASGNERVTLTYVKDAADATVLALEHPRPLYSAYNVAGPAENYLSLNQLYQEVRVLNPFVGMVTFCGQAQDLGPVDITRIRSDLDFEPRYSVRKGLVEIFQSFRRGERSEGPLFL
jgi:UDP-glucose 4-epimerase